MKISDTTPVSVLTDNDMFIVLQDRNKFNSATIQVLKDHFGSDFIAAPYNVGQSGQFLATNGAGETFWASLDGATITTDYGNLTNKPSINDVPLIGNLSGNDLQLAAKIHTHTIGDITDFPVLATVATTGDYHDLMNIPTIPAAVSVNALYDSGTNIANITVGEDVIPLYVPALGNSTVYRLVGTNYTTGGQSRTVKLQQSDDGTNWSDVSSVNVLPQNISVFDNDIHYVTLGELSNVAIDGQYSSLIGTPSIGDGIITITDDNEHTTSFALNQDNNETINLATVAFSGDYNDLINIPASASVNDGVLTITDGDLNTYTFSANQDTDESINLSSVAFTGDYNDLLNAPSVPGISNVHFSSRIIGPNKVVTGTQAVYYAKPIEGQRFSAWYLGEQYYDNQNPVSIQIDGDTDIAVMYDTVSDTYRYMFITDTEQCLDSGTFALPTYTLLEDGSPSATTLYRILEAEEFNGNDAANNIYRLFNGLSVEIEGSYYTCSLGNDTGFDFSQLVQVPNLKQTFTDSSNIYLFIKQNDGNTFEFTAYKYIDSTDSRDVQMFSLISPLDSWIKLGVVEVSNTNVGWLISKYTTEFKITEEMFKTLLPNIGPIELI